ncbi:TetR/AcrR family transcriptional regulator [Actinomycetes bacterium KLBMP 9797]
MSHADLSVPAAERPAAGQGIGAGDPHPDRTRERLVAAASELLAQGGVEAVTLRAVGTLTGVSRTAPYRHFQDKQELLSAVAHEGFVLMQQDMARTMAAGDDDGDVAAALHRACVAYVRAGLARPAHYRLMFGDRGADRPDRARDAAAAEGAAFFLGIIATAQRAGVIRAGEVRELAATIWALLHGLVDLTLVGQLRAAKLVDGAEAAPRIIAQLLAGLAPPPTSS